MRPEKDRVWKPRIRPADVPLIIRDLHHTRKASAGHLFTPPSKDRTHVKRHAELYNFIRERAARIDREQKAAIKANPDTLDTVDSGTFLFRFNSKIAVQGDVFLCDGLWRRQDWLAKIPCQAGAGADAGGLMRVAVIPSVFDKT